MSKVLVIGRLGQVGWEMQRCLHAVAEVVGVDRAEIDLADSRAVDALVRRVRPCLVINCAAYTAVDRAESEQTLAQAVNSDAVAAIGEAAAAIGAGVVHFSTDYVFPGDGTRPYAEDDPTGPLSTYGKTKLAGEHALATSGCSYWTFRTSWVYSVRGRNFVKAILARAKEQGVLRVVNDQHGAPTWARSLAQAVSALVGPRLDQPAVLVDFMKHTRGVYHLTAAGSTTWHEFATFMMERVRPVLPKTATVVPIATTEFQTAAVRPGYSVLSNDRFAATFGFRLPDWRVAASLCAAELAEIT